MELSIEKSKNLTELAAFLSEMNNQKQYHIGFCGEDQEDIYRSLKEDFIIDNGVNFFIARNSMNEITAAIGLDIDESSSEVWGPFNRTNHIELQSALWKELLLANPIVRTFYFFINNENTQQQIFMKHIKAQMTGEHLNLEITETDFKKVSLINSIAPEPSDFPAFEKLHNKTFPNTYYDAKTIMNRLNENNILKVIKTEQNGLQAYAYFEIDTEMKEASLEYIGVAEKCKNKGLGTMLLKEVLTAIFSYPQINEVSLTVDNTNDRAIHVYSKAGFKPADIFFSYRFEMK